MTITLVHDDLPDGLALPSIIAVDTETTGLDVRQDKLCLCQVGDGEGNAWLVKFGEDYSAPNLRRVLEDGKTLKLFHYARFDLAVLQRALGIPMVGPVFCTKIGSKLVRPTGAKHNLRTLVRDYCGVELDKSEQMSNWAAPELTESQQAYAASDVLYLHAIFSKMSTELAAANLASVMGEALRYLHTRVALDLRAMPEDDLFAHH